MVLGLPSLCYTILMTGFKHTARTWCGECYHRLVVGKYKRQRSAMILRQNCKTKEHEDVWWRPCTWCSSALSICRSIAHSHVIAANRWLCAFACDDRWNIHIQYVCSIWSRDRCLKDADNLTSARFDLCIYLFSVCYFGLYCKCTLYPSRVNQIFAIKRRTDYVK